MTPNPKHLYRVDRGYTHAWYVRIERGGINYDKLFSDSIYGSSEIAKAEAIKYRDEFLKTHPVSYKRSMATTRSKTGMYGVVESPESYIGYWYDNGGRKSQSFAKHKYGKYALLMAMFVRRTGKRINAKEWIANETANKKDK